MERLAKVRYPSRLKTVLPSEVKSHSGEGRGARESPRAPHVREELNIPPEKNGLEGIRSHNPTKRPRFSLKRYAPVKLLH